MRAFLCPREIGRNTQRGRTTEATAERSLFLSHGGASVPP